MILAVMACWYIAGWMPQNTQCGVAYDRENKYASMEACQMYVDDLQGKLPNYDSALKYWFGCFDDSVDQKKIPGLMKQRFSPLKEDG